MKIPSVTSASTPSEKRMSRRQRKNVKKREKDSDAASSSNLTSVTSSVREATCSTEVGSGQCSASTASKVLKKRSGVPSRHYMSLGLRDDQIYHYLHNYILDQHSLRTLGFPLESQLSPGKAWVYQDPEFRGGSFVYDDEPRATSSSTSSLDANAREFVPKRIVEDEATASGEDEAASTHSSSSLSAAAKEFVPLFSSQQPQIKEREEDDADDAYYTTRNCARCNKIYHVFKDTGECVAPEECVYHWGKARSSRKYSCCGRKERSSSASTSGCEAASCHVWRGILYEISGQHKDLEGFAKTRPTRNRAQPLDGNFGAYGLDGEMLFTTNGLQLCKITVVGNDGRLVYETFVQPEDPIKDFNTRFSGVSAKDLKRGPTKSLKDVQNDLLGFINANTILIGHGLENDLRALKMVHMTVIDTSLVFPHYYGMPFRRSLKSIVHSYLNSEIQAENSGHDSYEDARACVELMLWKVRQDYNTTSSSSSTLTDQQPPPAASSSTRGGQQGNGASSFQYSPFPPPQQQQPPEQ